MQEDSCVPSSGVEQSAPSDGAHDGLQSAKVQVGTARRGSTVNYFTVQGPTWVFIPDGTINKLRNGKEVDDYFDPSNSLTVNDLHLTTSDDLPFDHTAKSK
jgi:hypothetical protein